MLKFFRRIRRKLLDGGHLRKYFIYAIGEVFLVVIGILIALQINNWNEYNKDRSKEEVLLKQFRDEHLTNREFIKAGLAEYQYKLRLLQLQLEHTGPQVGIPQRQILDSIAEIPFIVVELVYNTINPALSNEQLGLLEGAELKKQLASFPGTMNSYKQYEKQVQDLTLKQRIIHQKYTAILSFSEIDPILKGTDFDSIRKARIMHESDYLGWLRDRENQNVIVDHIWNVKFAMDALRELQQHNEEILTLIAKELDGFSDGRD